MTGGRENDIWRRALSLVVGALRNGYRAWSLVVGALRNLRGAWDIAKIPKNSELISMQLVCLSSAAGVRTRSGGNEGAGMRRLRNWYVVNFVRGAADRYPRGTL